MDVVPCCHARAAVNLVTKVGVDRPWRCHSPQDRLYMTRLMPALLSSGWLYTESRSPGRLTLPIERHDAETSVFGDTEISPMLDTH